MQISQLLKGVLFADTVPRAAYGGEEVLKCAENPTVKFLIANTTEAGISYDPRDRPDLATGRNERKKPWT